MRYLIYFVYHPAGQIEPYVIRMLTALRPWFDRIHLVHNGPLALGQYPPADRVQSRPNTGFDVGAYRDAIAQIAPEDFAQITELTLANHTFFGPLHDLSRLFAWAAGNDADFWGISAHAAVTPNPFTGTGTLPYHLNSHWISVRARMLHDPAFRDWWCSLPEIDSYEASVLHHESRFTQHFAARGFRHAAYIEPLNGASAYPAFDEVADHPSSGLPILKRRLFFHQPVAYADATGANPRAVLEHTTLDPQHIWPSVVREAPPWVIYQNADQLFILPDEGLVQRPVSTVPFVADTDPAADIPGGVQCEDPACLPADAPVLWLRDTGNPADLGYGLAHVARDATVCRYAMDKLREPGIGLGLPVIRCHGRDAEIGLPHEAGAPPAIMSASGVAWIRAGLLVQARQASVSYTNLPDFAASQGLATVALSNTAEMPRNFVKLEARHRAIAGPLGLSDPLKAFGLIECLIALASTEGQERAREELAREAHDFGFDAGFDQGFDAGFRDGWLKAQARRWWRRSA